LVDNCLVKVDRMSMACSLEARVPLLDHRLVELAFQVPPDLKVRGGRTKILLKRVAARHVPPECVYRPKEGFSIPLKHWLKDGLRPLMEDLLSPARVGAGGLFESVEVDRLKREHLEGRANHSHLLWSLMVFEMWRRRWSV
ncbi:MAG: asparagine synthase-related protein, partial [Gemmatimonadota bacterium]